MTKLLAALSAVLLTGFASTFVNLIGTHTYTVTGHFLSAEGLTAGNDVLVAGVNAGKVDSVSLAPDSDSAGGALIKMTFDSRFAPLRRGTRMTIREKGFLGNMYVDVNPGASTGQPIPNGGTLPIEDTAAPVDLDQVMDTFDPATRAKIKTLTIQGDQSLQNRGTDVNHVLSDLPATSAQLANAAGSVDQSQQQLDQLTAEFESITQQMASEDTSLRSDLNNGASLLDTIAAREDRLQAEITYANQGLGAVNAGLSGHESDLARLLIEMPALQQNLRNLSSSADPALADVNMCYPNIIDAIAELAGATSYKHPGGAQDANGYELRVETYIAPAMNASTGSLNPPVQACSGGTPTP
jgi:phospholipid/cholesterol/gamma-HCH transport system substrate-binding protein